jgi:hypothetical protein
MVNLLIYEGDDIKNEILLQKIIESEDVVKVRNIQSYPYPKFYIEWKNEIVFVKYRNQMLIVDEHNHTKYGSKQTI